MFHSYSWSRCCQRTFTSKSLPPLPFSISTVNVGKGLVWMRWTPNLSTHWTGPVYGWLKNAQIVGYLSVMPLTTGAMFHISVQLEPDR